MTINFLLTIQQKNDLFIYITKKTTQKQKPIASHSSRRSQNPNFVPTVKPSLTCDSLKEEAAFLTGFLCFWLNSRPFLAAVEADR